MRDVFYENQFRLKQQSQLLNVHHTFYAALTAPDFDPLTDITLESFSGYETPQAVADYLVYRGADMEAEFQLEVTRNALLKVRAALRVVESQMSLSLQVSPRGQDNLYACLGEDKRQIKRMFEKAGSAITQAQENEKASPRLKEELVPLLQAVNTDFERIGRGIIRDDVLAMDVPELIEKVAQDRLGCVKLALDANELHLMRLNRKLNEATYILKAVDENIIPYGEVFKDAVESRLADAGLIMEKCSKRMKFSWNYMDAVSETGIDAVERFVPIRYQAAPVAQLFEMGT